MKKSNLNNYVLTFLDELEVFEDLNRGKDFKRNLQNALETFLLNETRENAFGVYKAFFDSYKITLPGETNPFADIIMLLEEYEKTAGTLIDNQRDHFIHSVNVFISGLGIYIQNEKYKEIFNDVICGREYKEAYQTKHEEFFYRWGIAALFHDIGYPIEIAVKQLNRFLRIVSDADGVDDRVKASIQYTNFEEIVAIKNIESIDEFTKTFRETYPTSAQIDMTNSLDLLAHRISQSLGTELKQTKRDLRYFTSKMAESDFIDHGYFSALIVMKWYSALIIMAKYKPEYFYWPVLDSATAILLHNYFKNVIRKEPYNHAPMRAEENPIAFLLILCDELQEWNREARGIKTKLKPGVGRVLIDVDSEQLLIDYISNISLGDSYCKDKITTFDALLDSRSIFSYGISVKNTVEDNE